MPYIFILEPIGFAKNISSYSNLGTSASQILRKRYSIDGIRMRKLRDNRISVSFTEPAAAIIAEIIIDIALVGNKAMLNQNAGNSRLSSTTNNGKFIADFHLKYTAISQPHR